MTDKHIESEDVRLGSLRIHVAHPVLASRSGVLLYPTIMGIDDAMRSFAQAFADAGMYAVVWDPYNGEDGVGDPMQMLAKSKEVEDRAAVRDLGLIVDHMRDELGLTSIAGIGWCFGGRIAIVHGGSDDRIQAVSAYNPTIWSPSLPPVEIAGHPVSRADFPGQTLDELALAATINGPVQVCHPAHDFTPPVVYQELMDVLRTRSNPTIYEFYPGVDHGFSYTPGQANEQAHRFAWATTLSMFSRCLEAA
ncbi:dienelactone hydrolase family protein [Nocardia pseudovaccinii]|uniref:dienelactone hydrolase family protein n=1 Tax=Nocardia pseudovaccinii TaxID=189540 RepID=UPI000AE03DCE|nr:dienelactone hydrolase family protein [Nocardia pseudovaccinii]